MKKINRYLLVGIIIGVLGLFGCGGDDVTPENINTVEEIKTNEEVIEAYLGKGLKSN